MRLPPHAVPGRTAKRAASRSHIGRPTSAAAGSDANSRPPLLMIVCGLRCRACLQPRSCRKVMVGQPKPGPGTQFTVRDNIAHRKPLLALLLVAPVMAGCAGGASDMFQSDLLSKDAQWFSRAGRLAIDNVSIETPPLTPNKPVMADDLVSAEGYCPGMAPPAGPADANAADRWRRRRAAARREPAPWRLVIPNATWSAASAHRQRQPVERFARRSRRGRHLCRRVRAPESTPSPPDA